jgi:hypothetical protein
MSAQVGAPQLSLNEDLIFRYYNPATKYVYDTENTLTKNMTLKKRSDFSFIIIVTGPSYVCVSHTIFLFVCPEIHFSI